jgi:hypothetical protein
MRLALALAGLLVWACTSGNTGAAERPASGVTGAAEVLAEDSEPAVTPTTDTPPPPPPPPVSDAAAAGSDGLARAEARSRAALKAQRPDATIEVRVLDGPGGTKIVRARDPAASPGTGVAALVYDPETGETYGKHGERGLARLVQARGWLDQRLPDAELIRLVHEARFDGVLILRDATVEAGEGGGLRVRLPVHTMRGDHRRTWIVTLPRDGDEAVAPASP